jgi:hypothetical protein
MATKHPAENLLKYLIVQDPTILDGTIQKNLEDWGFLTADPTYLPLLRQSIPQPPPIFDATNRAHRPSVRYLRDLEIYEFFHPNAAMDEAWSILDDYERRRGVEKLLLARLELKATVKKLNEKFGWHLSVDGVTMFRHAFWNVPSMTFDEWGRYMYNRTAMYEQYMSLLLASPKLAFYHLRLNQSIESKVMIQDVQRIAHAVLLEVSEKPGCSIDKVKSIKLLGSAIVEAHNALSTSDMALKDVLKQFEHWRMEHPQVLPPSVQALAPHGNYSGSGVKDNIIELNAKKE